MVLYGAKREVSTYAGSSRVPRAESRDVRQGLQGERVQVGVYGKGGHVLMKGEGLGGKEEAG